MLFKDFLLNLFYNGEDDAIMNPYVMVSFEVKEPVVS